MSPASETAPTATTPFRKALAWSYLMSTGRVVATLGVSLVLARLLGPEAFGLIAMANVYVLFADMLVGKGMTTALVQRAGLSTTEANTAFWIVVAAIGVFLPGSLLLAGWWSGVNSEPDLAVVIIALTPLVALRGLAVVPESLLLRNMAFKALAIRTNVAVVVGGVVGLTLALNGAGIWALVAQQLTVAVMELVAVWLASAWRPRVEFSSAAARSLTSFTGRASFGNVGVFIAQRSDALLIGLLFGPLAVGLYRMAARLVESALELTLGGLQSISLPELSPLQGDLPDFRRRSLELLRLASILTAPVFIILAFTSSSLMAVLGPRWQPAGAILSFLACLALFQVMEMMLGWMWQAAGRPGLHAMITWLGGGLSAASFIGAGLLVQSMPDNLQVLALAGIRTTTFAAMVLFVVLPLARYSLGLPIAAVLGAMARPATGAALGAVAATATLRALALPSHGAFPRLVVEGTLYALLCGIGVLMAEPVARSLVRGTMARFITSNRATESGALATQADSRQSVDGVQQPWT